jgi:hypothetical protein
MAWGAGKPCHSLQPGKADGGKPGACAFAQIDAVGRIFADFRRDLT